MKKEEAVKLIIEYGELLGKKNLTPGPSGNISVRFEDKILITASGSANGYLAPDDVVLMDFDGNALDGGKKPSSEKYLHIGVYNKRPDINAIIHVHSPYLSSFAAAGLPLDEPLLAENVFYFGQIPIAEYGLPSSMDLVEKTVKPFDKYNTVLMENHGVIIGEKTMKDAFLKLELAETYAQVVINTKTLGSAKLLTQDEVKAIENLK